MAYPVAVIGAGPAARTYIRSLKADHRLEVVGFTNRGTVNRELATKETGLPGFSRSGQLIGWCYDAAAGGCHRYCKQYAC